MTNTSSVMDQTTLIKVIEQYLTFSDNTSVIEFIRWIKRRLKLADISSVKEPGLSSMSKVSNHSGVINTSQLFICRCGHRYSLRFSMTDFLNDNNNNNNPLSSPYYNSSEQDCNDIDNNIVSDDDDGNLGGINEQNITNEPCSPNNGGRASRRKLSKPVRKDLATIQQSQQQVDTTNKDLTSNSPPNRSATSVGSRESDSANELSPNEIKRKYQKQSEDKLQKNTSKIARDVPIIHSKQRQNSVESKINRPPLVYHKPNHHSVSSFRHRCLRCGVLFRRRSSLARHRLRPCSNHQLLSSNVQIQKQIYSNNSHSVFHHRKHRSQQLSSFFICSYCSIRLYSREQFLNHESMHQKGYYYCKKCFEFFIPTYDNGQLKSHGCSESRKLAERTLLNAFAINEQTTNSVIEKNKTLIDREQVNDFLDNDVASVEDGTTLTIQEEQKDIIVSTQQNSIHQKQHDYNETDEHLEELKGLEQLIPPDTDSGELMINNDDDIDEAFDMNDEDEQITAKNNVGQVRNNSMGTMGEGERNQLNNLYQNDEINGKSPSVDDFNDQSAAARITRFGLPKLTDCKCSFLIV
ncbi:unnamed protein product [Didymodactylos carnosus]|uniref:C2H2-type domain-containing protein n=1 Tax=Didymodactylos carnosus TaxID=1234261 RepID=A0A8S2S296_9BILA|nr:unnamed protein product [Didymodactylos carnosus]CAF4200303.1 unnamed protein product [Didymodactylos carnosus]